MVCVEAVSYTHRDVYKRQDYGRKADETDAVFAAGGLNVTNMDKTGKILYTVKAATVDGQYRCV